MTFDELCQLGTKFNLVREPYCDNWRASELKGYSFETCDKEHILMYYDVTNHRVHFLPFVPWGKKYTLLYERWNHNIHLIRNLTPEKASELLKYSMQKFKQLQFEKKQREIEQDFEE